MGPCTPTVRLFCGRRHWGAALQSGAAAAAGAWIGVVDVDGDAEVDPYELIECLHRAREGAAVLV